MKQLHHLTALVFCIAMFLLLSMGVGNARGRYDNSVSWRGVYEPPVVEIETDLLSEEGYPVILSDWKVGSGEIQRQKLYHIRASAQNGSAAGKVSCQVENNGQYLNADLNVSDLVIDEDGENFSLMLSLTDELLNSLKSDVSDGDVSSGDAGGAHGPFPLTFAISVHWTGEGETGPVLWARFILNLVWEKPETVSGNDVTHEAAVVEEEAADPTAEVQTDSQTDSVQIISATDSFAWDEWFGMTVSVPECIDSLELQFSGMAFPKGTRYRIYPGEPMILGEDREIVIPKDSAEEQLILFYMENVAEEYKRSKIVLSVTGLDKSGNPCSFTYRTLSATATPLSLIGDNISGVIQKGGELVLPGELSDEDVTWHVEYLVRNSEGKLVYESREDQYGLSVRFLRQLSGSEERALIISNGAQLAPAGSYRLVLKKTYAGVETAYKELPFFIHY